MFKKKKKPGRSAILSNNGMVASSHPLSSSVGIEIIERDKGTGYHIKEGIFISNKIYSQNCKKEFLENKDKINICNLSKMTLEYFEVK